MKDILSFPKWLTSAEPNFNWQLSHHRYLYRRLSLVTGGQCRRLMVFMPPRHGKSELVTIRYAAWRILREPKLKVIIASYNQKLANRFSRRVRAIVAGEIKLARDRHAAEEWETESGGGVRAVGIGAGITGFGGGLVIIDDPVKNRAEAESRNRRDAAWEWFNDDIFTRLEPSGQIVVIQTRWHEDDLSGRLLMQAENGGESWTVVRLPALAIAGGGERSSSDPLGRKPHEALWPERFSTERLAEIQRQLGTYSFSALYQQEPVPRDGGLFKRAWFQRVTAHPPNGLVWARGYDLAVATTTTSDHTASFRCAFGRDGTLYIADGFRRRVEYPQQRQYVIERLRSERDTAHGIESALHGKALVQDIRSAARTGGAPLRSVRVDNDKWTRALSWAPFAEDGKVVLIQGSWIDDFIDEVCSFPNGKHDDQVDAVSISVRMLLERKGKFSTYK